ncbi:hypothetical protein J3U99_04105 [Brucella pituitosa]|uniref:hypothetical protein n=1 Tax=Brucella TaxID=234 RepID=UPI000464B879|nr:MULTISPECIES: hypothetical protein [Brucella]PQZ51277.1 hypothetical protein CQZ90_00245 [Ochrobactrum sp. MYb19]PRA50603.1 hypothetical protein CQ062_20960 [Ochrobactrum sp. MYb68]PRA65689.1 hypothetical protein CQ053_12175 [Ochrobactrum sp. MYb18]PRA77379.1 hypothetical protein CQ049_08650 [Brucella thiophenivorans]PRA87693.1 hypothetical protein CQ054_04590 [Ochrobactrum sp. MYb29]PRA92986.1 hypothetical protein CQ051_00245 [Ochrobactrum sp. MYb14]PRA99389.1 hypothetical protein CQ052_
MRRTVFTALIFLAGIGVSQAASTTETIIMLRHGEKPEQGLGQLNCQGLNRALKLPAVIEQKFGKPDFIFAPNPAQLKEDKGAIYSYNRPLATVEPTAIKFGMPVDTRFGFKDIEELQATLAQPDYRNATVLVSWEHKQLVKLARNIVKDSGIDKALVPKWPGEDFDSMYVLRITRDGAKTTTRFEQLKQGLNNQSASCPS